MTLRDIDAVLVKKGWPPVSAWWWSLLDLVYSITGLRNIVVRGGRRGGKSSTICGRVVPYELLAEHHAVPPGDFGWFAIISADKDQAQERLDTCHKALDELQIAHRYTANEITINGRNVGVKVFAATTGAVVSFTCIGFLCDEMSRWRSRDSLHNPADEIVKSLRPTMATMPNARGWYVSAPFSTLDIHHEMIEQGTNASQMVFIGTTPEMNPTLTDEMIVALEPDKPTRDREYYVIPMRSDATKFFAAEFIDAAARTYFADTLTRITAGGDFAFRRDASAMVALAGTHGKNFRLLKDEERLPGTKALVPSVTISELSDIAENYGADSIACDLHYIETVRETIADMSLELLEYPSNENEKHFVRLRVLLAQGRLDLSSASDTLIKQLKSVTGRPMDGAGLKIEMPRREGEGHGDIVSALVAAIWAQDQPRLARDAFRGTRRFVRGDDGRRVMRDLPPSD